MDNNITIDIEYIKTLPDNSISDSEIIRQIVLQSIRDNDHSLIPKIRKEFYFAGLYPYVMKAYNITPDEH